MLDIPKHAHIHRERQTTKRRKRGGVHVVDASRMQKMTQVYVQPSSTGQLSGPRFTDEQEVCNSCRPSTVDAH